MKRKQGGKLTEPVTVVIRGGTEFLREPLRFTPEDSGTAAAPITYVAAPGEQPVVSGGRVIGGFHPVTVDGRKLWAADIPAVREGKWYFREIWINGQRRQRARTPNQGFYRVAAVPDMNPKDSYQVAQKRFQYAPGEITHLKNLEDVEVVILSFWTSVRRGIASIDEDQRMMTLTYPNSFRLTDGFGNPPKPARYFVENAFELLDAPGEWYLDRKAGKLYYMAMSGEDMAKAEVIAPVLEQVLLLTGDARKGQYVEYVTFRGLTFSHAEWWVPADDPHANYQRQGQAKFPGAIEFFGARHCGLERCTGGAHRSIRRPFFAWL